MHLFHSGKTCDVEVHDQPSMSSAPQVNTRLQVEHGITEYVSRQDLVQWMLQLQVSFVAML